MSDEPKTTNDSEKKDIATNEQTEKAVTTSKPWDEARVVVFLIGICLLIEGLLIYYQAGSSQVLVASTTGLGGLVMMLMAWLLPFEDDESDEEDQTESSEEDSDETDSEKTKLTSEIPQSKIPTEERPVVVETSEKKEEKPVEETEKKKLTAETAESLKESDKPPTEELSWFQRLSIGLTKTREGFVGKLKKLVFGTTKIDADLMDELEETLF